MSEIQSKSNTIFLEQHLNHDLERDYLIAEDKIVKRMLLSYDSSYAEEEINLLTIDLINYARENHSSFGLEQFLQEYPLTTTEGAVLMSLAEALLRISDRQTALKLIHEQFSKGDWAEHIGVEHSWFMNVSTWSVLLSNKLLSASQQLLNKDKQHSVLLDLFARLGENSLLAAINKSIEVIGKQFVLAENINDALKQSHSLEQQGYHFTYDMLGEEAITQAESDLYLDKYLQAIENIGEYSSDSQYTPSISVKLSALHPRFEILQSERVFSELFKTLKKLCLMAKKYHVALVVDAEESERLGITLKLFEMLLFDKDLEYWDKLGIAVQSYQKRAPLVIDLLISLAKKSHRRIIIRLVKGAYWDYEIKYAQQQGLVDFPVFSKKMNTELCYMYCVQKLFSQSKHCYPQFATHNAQTIASVYYYANKYHCHHYEFQQLFGMGKVIYQGFYHWIKEHNQVHIPCSVYTPIGVQETLLPYLVRRMIENGANNSFVNQLYNREIRAEDILVNLNKYFINQQLYRNLKIPKSSELFSQRKNSIGLNISSSQQIQQLAKYFAVSYEQIIASPLMASNSQGLEKLIVHNPVNQEIIGQCNLANSYDCSQALSFAVKGFYNWKNTAVEKRSKLLNKVADLLEKNRNELVFLLVKEAGKVLIDALNELREAVDFCRYYASIGLQKLNKNKVLVSYTGEENSLILEGRGVFLCISPWNFPLAIFTGQITAALMAGNSVLAKPASLTPLIAYKVVQLFYQAGVPQGALQFLPAKIATINQVILNSSLLTGVAFTGSFNSATEINKILANKSGAITPLIAETGGINALLADSSALSEQLVSDMVLSAFGSAGQRCSALRIAFIQDDIYDKTIKQLHGAMQELQVSDPMNFATDLGPLISQQAVIKINSHINKMRNKGLKVTSAGRSYYSGENFILPTLIELNDFTELTEEVFGPVLHVIPFQGDKLEQVITAINQSGFGLTFAVHSRIMSRIWKLSREINAGNIYINRNMIGAVVGVQPFGGRGQSGTGPKAGGPNYLQRFVQEKTISYNSSSIGGNLKLLNI